MSFIYESIVGRPKVSFDACPRRSLFSAAQRAADEHNLSILVGFEIEFMIAKIRSDDTIMLLASNIGRYAAVGMSFFDYVEECVERILATGIGVLGFHVEGTRGQYEISLDPQPPLEAVDGYILAKDIIKDIFARHGYIATMFPKPFLDRPANVQPTEKDEELLAGVLKRLPAICAPMLPYDHSYCRMRKREAGDEVRWGTESRDMPVRKIRQGHWEIRCSDATANVYLAVTSILSSGLLGIQVQEPLTWVDCKRDKAEFSQNSSLMLPQTLQNYLTSC
ncbi:hypothetical protein BDW59DRAFT_160088 [Aspergillus cavernicola]|uniref:GS catalytic domain-containing protein n=1 Tax=Aspergillus cavernicola TaxID=176166 RepID=A0ABR4IJ51_9EURO